MDRNDNRVQLRGGRRSIADAKDVTGIGDVQLRVLQARCVKRGRHFTAARREKSVGKRAGAGPERTNKNQEQADFSFQGEALPFVD